jgi:hypothetical protein
VSVAIDSSGNVYFAGAVGTSSGTVLPCYWENGTLTILPVGTGSSVGWANGVAVDASGNLWIGGAVGASNSALVPCSWRNGALTFLPTGSGAFLGYGNAVALDASGNLFEGFALRPLEATETGPRYAGKGREGSRRVHGTVECRLLPLSESRFLPAAGHRVSAAMLSSA